MSVLTEGQLEFDFPAAIQAMQFDDGTHGLSHCMKAVDFIVELTDRYLFIEVKDPFLALRDPAVAPYAEEARRKFLARLTSDELARELTGKYRDSFLFRWAEERLDKDVYYIVLLEIPSLGPPEYLAFTERLKQLIPANGAPSSWARPLVQGVAVLNIASWNALGAYGSVKRVS